jgi:exopolyphosphatase/guanosine-5'-triphosphate,3'-diphosphate pyrophosphatase
MILAVIDCGTNTFNLLIVEVNVTVYTKLFNTRIPVKLGEGTINKGFIDDVPFNRGLLALKEFKKYLTQYNVTKTLAYATSAIRSAKNGMEFIQKSKTDLGIEISVIDGDREAELIYLGNKVAANLNNNVALIMDIGGGSTEFILANGKEIFWKQSYLLGAARLLEKFKISDPIQEQEIEEIYNYLIIELQSLYKAIALFPPSELVGSSGAFDSIIEMIHAELNGEMVTKEKICYNVLLENYHKIANLIVTSTFAERKNIKGLIPMRLDMIVISSLLINFILKTIPISKFLVSSYSLKEGALMEYIQKNNS